MSQPFRTIEPSVIDDKMLEEMVKKQGPSGRAGQIAQMEGIDFKDVDHLQLDFQNILKIDNLWQFTSLTKLQLDNNVIEKIEGLNTLSNLIWLDLSFNNIEMIEGLDELVKLEDLSLYSNRISKFENMDSLVNLQIFSIGKNHISDLESVVYLRRFKRLRTLNLAGNPVSENERYSMYIPAFLPNLMYLDFRLIDKVTKELALQMHNSAIANLVQEESLEFKSLERMRLEEEELALHQEFEAFNQPLSMQTRVSLPEVEHYLLLTLRERLLSRHQVTRFSICFLVNDMPDNENQKFIYLKQYLNQDAYVEYLNGPGLFDSMYTEDLEALKFLLLPGVSEFVEQYKIEFTEVCQKLFKYGLEGYDTRNKEVESFLECLREANEDNQQNGVKIIKEFEEKNKESLNEMQHITESLIMESKTRHLRAKINKLWSRLMSLEMQLVDQLEEASREFEGNISEMVSTYVENVQALIAQCRDLENRNHENMLEIAMSSYDKMGKTEGDEEMPEELRALFIDKDTVVNTVNASHDLHLLKIDNQEDKMVTKGNGWVRDTLEKLHTDEIGRNRKRVLEINIYINHWRDELDFLEIQ